MGLILSPSDYLYSVHQQAGHSVRSRPAAFFIEQCCYFVRNDEPPMATSSNEDVAGIQATIINKPHVLASFYRSLSRLRCYE